MHVTRPSYPKYNKNPLEPGRILNAGRMEYGKGLAYYLNTNQSWFMKPRKIGPLSQILHPRKGEGSGLGVKIVHNWRNSFLMIGRLVALFSEASPPYPPLL